MKASDQTAVEWALTADSMIGRIIGGKYRIRGRVGGGAMGVVYDAKQIALDKRVAIKVLNDDLQHNKHFVARFQVEAKAASLLDHANSTRVFDFGKDDSGLLYICMEFLEGHNLLEVIETQSPLPAARIVDLTAQTLAALARAHDLGILHRDLKPENIMVLKGEDDEGSSRDVVKVCDFGIAKFDPRQHLSESSPPGAGAYGGELEHGAKAPSGNWKISSALTQVGLIIGTPDYMSPEQARGEPVDERSEIYSVGVVLYHLLAGRVPFEGGDVLETLTRHMTLDPEPPSTIRSGVDPELEAICRIAMSKDPAARYRSARDMRAALRSTAACRRVGGGRAAMFSFVPPARTMAMNGNAGGPAWSLVPSVAPAMLSAGSSLAPPMNVSIGPALASVMGPAMGAVGLRGPLAPAMRAMMKEAPPPLDRQLKATVPAPASAASSPARPSVAVTSPAPALTPTRPAPSALALAMTLAGASMAAERAAPGVLAPARATTSTRSPALPVAKLALQDGPARRRPVAVLLAAAITALSLGGAFAAFGHPSLAATAAAATATAATTATATATATASSTPTTTPTVSPGVVAGEIAIALPASGAPLALSTAQAPSPSASADVTAATAVTAVTAAGTASSATTSPPVAGAVAGASGKGKRFAAETMLAEPASPEAPVFEPGRGRVAVVREDAEGFERHLVNELLGHASLERCYIEALKAHGSAATGSTLLTLQVANGKVAAASLSTDLGLQSLRPCLDTQLVGQPMGEAGGDEGAQALEGVAHVTLQLTDL